MITEEIKREDFKKELKNLLTKYKASISHFDSSSIEIVVDSVLHIKVDSYSIDEYSKELNE